jgi:hypothetical protein
MRKAPPKAGVARIRERYKFTEDATRVWRDEAGGELPIAAPPMVLREQLALPL